VKIEIIPLSDITPYANNPRDNEAAVDAVARSIKEYGFRQPIVVDPDCVIVAGDTRYKAAQRLGLDTVPVHRADLTPQQIAAYRLEDNKSGELADWDFSKLKIELDALKADEFDFGALSFSTDELGESPGFNPVGVDEQPRLDEKKPITCPNCSHEFTT
jgi:ParB-like chromosome segregation protein Spo0J